jgi:alkyl sulfatase BDS1-like metallo-beta-lactamase superfamily hydrolase
MLAGGVDKIVARALEKLTAGDLAMAAHLIDWAVAAAPDDTAAHEARMSIYDARARSAISTMAHGVFRAAVIASAKKLGRSPSSDKRSF